MAHRAAEPRGAARYQDEAAKNGNGKTEVAGEKTPKRGLLARWTKAKKAEPGKQSNQPTKDQLHNYINAHWKPGLYGRSYVNLSGNVTARTPSDAEIDRIYKEQLNKTCKEDELNCGACGYGACRRMAMALHNGLSRVEHCASTRRRNSAKKNGKFANSTISRPRSRRT